MMQFRSGTMRRLDTEHHAEGGIKAVWLRLWAQGLSDRKIAASFGLNGRTVGYYMAKFRAEEQSNATSAK